MTRRHARIRARATATRGHTRPDDTAGTAGPGGSRAPSRTPAPGTAPRLGNALKRAREAAGKTQDEAAAVIDSAASKISRLELGQSGIRLTDLKLLLDFYGVTGEDAEPLRDLARAERQRGRWSGYRNVVPDWFRQYLDLEADATEIRWYQPEVLRDGVAVRDSKDKSGPILAFTSQDWRSFVDSLKTT